MPTNAELVELARQRLYANYKPAPLAIVRGKGCELFDADGRRWLDLCAGVAVSAVGHAHPVLARAIAEQAASVIHVSNYFYNEQNVMLADALCKPHGSRARLLLQLRDGGQRGAPQGSRATTSTRRDTRTASASSRSTTPSTGARSARCR